MDNELIQNIYQAYTSGAMSPEEVADYEADVNAGQMQLPSGTTLQKTEPTPTVSELDQGILEAYKSGAMSREDKIQLEADVVAGEWLLPAGEQLDKTEELGFFEGVAEQVTGTERTTPETEKLSDWASMPEMNTFSMASFKSALGTMITNPEETVQVIKANYPGVEVRQDEKGNFVMRSSIDGEEYAIKPGLQVSDIPRVAGGTAAFTPAGRAVTLPGQIAGAAGTQAAIEATQIGTGGEFDVEQIPLAGAGAGAGFLAGKVLGKGYEKFRRAAPEVPTAPLKAEELATTTRRAAEGGIGATGAREVLAREAMPDPKVIEAAKRLGVDEYLQPDHVSTNQAYRELSQAVKSIPGSQARVTEIQGLEQIAKRADNLVGELGGLQDLSMMDKTVKSRLQTIQSELTDKAENLYGQLRRDIPAKTSAPATNMVNWINSRVDELDGVQFLSTMERSLLKRLSPTVEGVQPTYARLDDVRKSLTAARIRKEGAFKDADSGLIKKLERELLKDQQAVAESISPEILNTFNTARQSVAVRKGVEDDMKALFGKELQGTMIGDLSGAVKKLSAGDVSKFVQVVKAVPEDIRKEVVASGLNTAFGKTAKNGQLSFTNYAKWYEGLLKNKQAHTALMTNLPAGARKQLSDLYRVSNGIRKATRERITTGRIQAVKEELRGADTLIGNIYDVAKRSAVGVAAEAVTTPMGIPGAGIAAGISSALTRGKADTLKAADKLITSPEFIEAASQGTEEAARKFAASSIFKKFFKSLGKPQELTNLEQWVLGAFQTQRQMKQEAE